jgi:hypothetical protein
MLRRAEEAKRVSELLRQLNTEREVAGVCRHCGGSVPCFSEFGDQRVGVRHSSRSHAAMKRAMLEP